MVRIIAGTLVEVGLGKIESNKIPEIIEMGVDSLKIEGRLKTEYYLASVVNAYRK